MTLLGPSEHLTWAELACHDAVRTPYPLALRETTGKRLGEAFEVVRYECGDRPLQVLSGFRTVEHNVTVADSASRSTHTKGEAVDIRQPLWIIAFGDFVARVFRAREKRPDLIKGIGVYPGRRSVHIDVRTSELLAFWVG